MTIHTEIITDEVPADGTKGMEANLIIASVIAGDISKAASTANWLRAAGAGAEWSKVHTDIIERNFADLAKALGYRVEKIEDPAAETPEAA